MKKEKDHNRRSEALVTVLVVALIITVAIGGYFVGATKFTLSLLKEKEKTTQTTEEKNSNNEEKTDTNGTESPYRSCVGTYKGTGPVSVNTLTNETKTGNYVLTLQKDGSFNLEATLDGNVTNGNKGYYFVMKNSLILIYGKEVTGPYDQDPIMNTSSLLISEDCSSVSVNSFVSNEKVLLNK